MKRRDTEAHVDVYPQPSLTRPTHLLELLRGNALLGKMHQSVHELLNAAVRIVDQLLHRFVEVVAVCPWVLVPSFIAALHVPVEDCLNLLHDLLRGGRHLDPSRRHWHAVR